MSEFEPPIYEAGALWGQVKRGISGLVLPENVSDPKSEVVNGEIEATVTMWGETDRIVLK